MPASLFWFFLPYISHSVCPWPLEETMHDDVILYFNYTKVTPCALGCGIDPTVAIFHTLEEQQQLDRINVVLSFAGLTFAFWSAINLCLRHQDYSKGLWRADLIYQIPILITIGYFLFIGTLLFHPGSILINSDSPSYCNQDEKTLASNDPTNGNVVCTLLSLLVFISIKIIISYTTLLSILLFRLFWFPFSRKIRRCKIIAHGTIWMIIVCQVVPIVVLKSIKGDMTMRICLPTLESPNVTFYLEIIPIVLYQSVGTVLLFACLYKIWKMWVLPPEENENSSMGEEDVDLSERLSPTFHTKRSKYFSKKTWLRSKNDSHSKNLRELTFQLLIFNIVESIFVGLLCFNLVYWYNHFDKWKTIGETVVTCQIDAYGMPFLEGTEDSDETLLEAAYGCIGVSENGPPPWCYCFFFIVSLGGALAGCILSCSKATISVYRRGIASLRWKIGFFASSRRDTNNSQRERGESEMVSVTTDDTWHEVDQELKRNSI